MTDRVNIEVPVFEAGDYSKYGYSNYSENDIRDIAERTNSFGVKPLQYFSDVYKKSEDTGVPLTFEHTDTTGIVDAGFANGFKAVGSKLMASISIPQGIFENLNEKIRGLSIEINPKSKIISKITMTKNPLVPLAMFSVGALSGIAKDENLELFSFSEVEEINNMNENSETLEETQEEVVEDAIVETEEVETEEVIEESVEEDVVETLETEQEDEAMSENEALKSKLAKLEEQINNLEDEKIEAKIESFSTEMVSKGVPPIIAQLLSPTIVKGETERFSASHGDFAKVAKEVMDFFAKDEAFKSKVKGTFTDEYIRGEETEGFSAEAARNKVKKYCKENDIKIGSQEYLQMLAIEAVRTAE